MGITGLLPLLKKASSNTHVRKFSGCTVGIDAYVWLHKGAFGCAEKLGKGEPTTAYVTYCLKYINVLLANNVKPVVVLDGRNLPSKSETEKKRREKRDENRKNAKEFLRKGMKKEAWECFTRCIDVTPAMARELIKVLRSMKIDYIIAPYEADAQLAYLAKKKIIDIVITEDSDLILFGCPKIFFKMNPEGHGVLFDESKLPTAMGLKPESFIFDRFRKMCILSGCDYLASLPGIGLGRAKKLVDGTNSNDIRKILMGISNILRLDIEITEEYVTGFLQAENTFLYQLVFDPTTRELVPLTPYPEDFDIEEIPYAGSYKHQDLALGMALGNIDIHTLKVVDNFDPVSANSGYDMTSMWHRNFDVDARPSRAANPRLSSRDVSEAFSMEVQTMSVKNGVRKRVLQDPKCEEEEETESNDVLRSLYKTENEEVVTDFYESNEQTVKRIKIDEDIQTKAEETKKSKNPFLKFKFSKTVSETNKTEVTEKCTKNPGTDKEQEEEAPPSISQDVSCTSRILRSSVVLSQSSSVDSAKDDEDYSDSDDDCTSKFFRPTSLSQNSLKENSSELASPSDQKQKDSSSVSDSRSSVSVPLNPVCLVEKNRVYDDDNHRRIVVKSQYFKDSSFVSSKNSDVDTADSSQEQEDNCTLSFYSISKKSDVDSGCSDDIALMNEKECEDEEETGENLEDEDESPSKSESNRRSTRPVVEITLDDDERVHKSSHPTKLNPCSSRLPSKPAVRPSKSTSRNHNRSSRNSDPKQPSLMTMFARQAKSKI